MTGLRVPHGTVHTDDRVLAAFARDFGGVVHRMPRAVVRPASDDDVVVAVRWAAANGVPLAARGTGHAMGGQALVEDGVVLDMTALAGVRAVEADRAVVDAGTRWSTLLAATLPRGLAPPVLTDYVHTTVGGTLSTGGLGGMSHRHGAQTDQVLALDVVTPGGEALTCSPTRHRDLFDAVRAGLGRHGVIVRATVALVPAPATVRVRRFRYPDARAFTADLRRLVAQDRFDYVEGFAKHTATGATRYEIETADPGEPALSDLSDLGTVTEAADVAYPLFLDRLAPAVAARRAAGDWTRPHPWPNAFVPDAAADDLLEEVMAELTPADFGDFGLVLTYPVRTATPRLRLPDGGAFLLALLLTDRAGETRDRNARLHERVRAVGGTRYAIS